MNRSIVFFDIDGTIWDLKQRIPESTVRALKKLRENGHYAFLNSGRTRSFIHDSDIRELSLDGIVGGCGTYVEMDHEVIFNHLLDDDLVDRTVSLLKGNHMPLVLEGCDKLYFDEEDFEGDPFLRVLLSQEECKACRITGVTGERRVNKMSVNMVEDNIEEILGRLSEHYEILVHGGQFMELVPRGFSKATGMKVVADRLGVPREDTFAFGDSRNDLEMLRAAGVGVVMGNGTDEAKAAGDFVTKPLDEDGIEYALKYHGLI
ncbi:MAG: Cof-type HAD-IIB family hydrolase [Eubacterium sp.]|nr:Cof-type HAD-IIB family hydrolase [Eubacterium sp.]